MKIVCELNILNIQVHSRVRCDLFAINRIQSNAMNMLVIDENTFSSVLNLQFSVEEKTIET